MFKNDITLEVINAMGKGCMVEHLDIEFIELGEDYLTAKMPVDNRTQQPFGLLHGGASVVLAETLGSVAANCTVDPTKYHCVGQEINANHTKSVRSGFVYGRTTPLHIGKKTQVWQIRITDEEGNLVCISRITLAVLEKKINPKRRKETNQNRGAAAI